MNSSPTTAPAGATGFAWGQFAVITAVAAGIFLGLRLLPTGTNLSHMDFRVDAKGAGTIEFCDPLNPQFIPVVAVRSPVTMAVATAGPAVAGRELRGVVTLRTGSGKPVAPEDLLVTHTRKLHLLVVDPSLADYQHLHPVPTGRAGEWSFAFSPRRAGVYRIFGDFTPAATGRGLYASDDLPVAAAGAEPAEGDSGPARLRPGAVVERNGLLFALQVSPQPARATQPIELRFTVKRPDGGAVGLETVMGAYAHLVAFDEARSGFAHLHPVEVAPGREPDRQAPVLDFKLTIPRAGRYTVWAQVSLGGREEFVPFGLEVVPPGAPR